MLLSPQDAGHEINSYNDELLRTAANIQEMRDVSQELIYKLGVVERSAQKVEDLAERIESFDDNIANLLVVFKLMKKAPPLKVIATLGEQMIRGVEKITDKLADKARELAEKIRESEVAENARNISDKIKVADGYLAKGQAEVLEQQELFHTIADVAGKAYILAPEPVQVLGTLTDIPEDLARGINDGYDDAKELGEGLIAEAQELLNLIPAADFRIIEEIERGIAKVLDVVDVISGPLNAVTAAIKPIEPLLGAISFIASITVDPVINFVLKTLKIDKVIDAAAREITIFLPDVADFDLIGQAVDKITAPLRDLINLEPTFDHDQDEKIINAAGDTDPTLSNVDGVAPTGREIDIFGFAEWITSDVQGKILSTIEQKVETTRNAAGEIIRDETSDFVRSRIGSLDAEGIGMAMVIPETIAVNRGLDYDPTLAASFTIFQGDEIAINSMMLLGDTQNNTLITYGGRNLLYGGIGNDTLIGDGELNYSRTGADGAPFDVEVSGSSERDTLGDLIDESGVALELREHVDTAVFTGKFRDYTFSGDPEGTFVVEQLSPVSGSSFDGRDTLIGIDQLVFLGDSEVITNPDGSTTVVPEVWTVDEVFSRYERTTQNRDLSTLEQYALDGPDDDDPFLLLLASPVGRLLTGGVRRDIIIGGEGDDTILGGLGDDTIDPFRGSDSIDGGEGRDTITSEEEDISVNIDLRAGEFSIRPALESGLSVSRLTSIENATLSIEEVNNPGGFSFINGYIFGDDHAEGNVLLGASTDDVLHGRGGDDSLGGGAGDDLIIGGFGRDSMDGGTGDDLLMIADAARPDSTQTVMLDGVSHLKGESIRGGEGHDTVIYESRYDWYDRPNLPTSIDGWQSVIAQMPYLTYSQELFYANSALDYFGDPADLGHSGAIRVHAGTSPGESLVERLALDGSTIAVDVLTGVESFVGSSFGDEMFGGFGEDAALDLVGGGGEDTIHAQEARGLIDVSDGGQRDEVYAGLRESATALEGEERNADGTYDPTRYLGDAADVLNLSGHGNLAFNMHSDFKAETAALWTIKVAQNGQTNFVQRPYINLLTSGFGEVIFGDGDDNFTSRSGSIAGERMEAFGGKGGDRFIIYHDEAEVIVHGQEGDDEIIAIGGTGYGDAGSDTLSGTIFDHEPGATYHLDGGAGNDILQFGGGFAGSHLAGGDEVVETGAAPDGGRDVLIIIDEIYGGYRPVDWTGGVEVDLVAGTITSTVGHENRQATISGIEVVIGSKQDDILRGTAADDELIGAAGNDTIEGLAGAALNPNESQPTVTVDGAFDGELQASFTVEAWINTDEPGLNGHPLTGGSVIVGAVSGTSAFFKLTLRDDHILVDVHSSEFTPRMIVFDHSVNVADGQDHHIAARYDVVPGAGELPPSAVLTLFIDGVEIASQSNPSIGTGSLTGPITIGDLYDGFGRNFEGDTLGVRVWDNSRTDAQIAASAAAGPTADPIHSTGLDADDEELLLDLVAEVDGELGGNILHQDAVLTDRAPRAYDTEGTPLYTPYRSETLSGDDALYGGDGADDLYGGDGDDLLHGGGIPDASVSGGYDRLFGGAGTDTASFTLTSPGKDGKVVDVHENSRAAISVTLEDAPGNTTIGSATRLRTDEEGNVFEDPNGVEAVLESIENVIGTRLDDWITGNNGNNVLHGGEGADLVNGAGGKDVITILGDDTVDAGDGDDTLIIGLGSATVTGGAGTDRAVFDTGHLVRYDPVNGIYVIDAYLERPTWANGLGDTPTEAEARAPRADGVGPDAREWTPEEVLEAETPPIGSAFAVNRGPVTIYTGTLTDIELAEGFFEVTTHEAVGTASADQMHGSLASDDLYGRKGDDLLFGHDGDDTLIGGAGSDSLTGGTGDDSLHGGGGSDEFHFHEGKDRVSDFNTSLDRIIVKGEPETPHEIRTDVTPEGLMLSLSDEDSLFLEGVGFREADAIFVTSEDGNALDLGMLFFSLQEVGTPELQPIIPGMFSSILMAANAPSDAPDTVDETSGMLEPMSDLLIL